MTRPPHGVLGNELDARAVHVGPSLASVTLSVQDDAALPAHGDASIRWWREG